MSDDEKSKNIDGGAVQKSNFKMNGIFSTRYLQAFLLFLGMVTAFTTRSSLSVALVAMTSKEPDHRFPHYDWTDKFGLISSVFIIGLLLMQIPIGYLITIKSPKIIHGVCMLLSGILHALVPPMAVIGDWMAVVVVRILLGGCQASLMSCTQALLAKWTPPVERSRLSMFVFNGAILGSVIGMLFSGLLVKSYSGWPSVFYVFGGLNSLWALIFFYYGADSPAKHPNINKEEKEYIESSIGRTANEPKKLKTPWREICTSIPVWSLAVANCGDIWGFFILLTLLPNYMSNVIGFDIKDSAIISSLPYCCALLLVYPYSCLSDYLIKKGVTLTNVRKICSTIAMWIPGLAMLLLCVIERGKIVTVVIMIVAVSFSCGTFSGYQVSKIDMSPNFAGAIMSITNFFGNAAALLGPNFFNLVVTEVTNPDQWNVIFLVTSLFYFVSNAVFVIFGTSKKQPWNEVDFTRSMSNKNTDACLV